MDCDSASLLLAAKCFGEISTGDRPGVRDYLLCQWANKPTCDPDALAFIAAAGITDPTQITAVCKLVLDLKTTGAPTSFWDRDIIIYPMVGGTAAAHRLNLKDRTGTYDMTYVGAGLVHNANGIKGNSAAYADTHYITQPAQLNSIRWFWYTDTAATVNDTILFGTNSGGRATLVQRKTAAGVLWAYALNDFSIDAPWAAGVVLGSSFIQRQAAGTKRGAIATSVAWTNTARAVTNEPTTSMVLFGYWNAGAIALQSNVGLSGFSVGSPLTTDAEMLAYKAIWDTYENALGRGHPLGV